MKTTIAKMRWLGWSVLGACVAVLALSWGPTARADDDRYEDMDRGWVVQYGNQRDIYRFEDRWRGATNPAGFTLRNDRTRVNIYYYGSFKVVEKDG